MALKRVYLMADRGGIVAPVHGDKAFAGLAAALTILQRDEVRDAYAGPISFDDAREDLERALAMLCRSWWLVEAESAAAARRIIESVRVRSEEEIESELDDIAEGGDGGVYDRLRNLAALPLGRILASGGAK